MKKLDLDTVADFTWCWNYKFFLETKAGNFIWSDPDYPGGDNTIRPYKGSYADFLRENHIEFGRDKGKHIIRDYCGENVLIVG